MLRLDRLRPRLGRGHHTPEARAGQPSVTAHEDPELAKIMARDARDNEVLAVILAAALSADAHVIDVGAHNGTILEKMLHFAPRGRHLAFEPMPEYAAALRERFPAVEVHEAALSDNAGEATFRQIIDLPAYSGLQLRSLPAGEHVIKEITVDVERLDDVLPEGFSPTFIKIDVEGGEVQVLRGATETLRRHRPIVVFEHGIGASEHYGTSSGELHDLLFGECGMRIYDLAGDGPFSRDEFEALFPKPIWNFLARP